MGELGTAESNGRSGQPRTIALWRKKLNLLGGLIKVSEEGAGVCYKNTKRIT